MTPRLLSLALLVPAVALAAPAPSARSGARPSASPAADAPSSAGKLEVGGFVGYETADFSGLSLRLDGELPLRPLTRSVALSVVGSVGYSHLTWSPRAGVDGTANVLKLVPALRLRLPVAPRLALFADAGLGLAHVSATVEFPAAWGAPKVSDSTLNLMLRLGVGAWYAATDRLELGVLLELDPIFGDFGFSSAPGVSAGSQTTFLAQVGAQYRL